MPTHFNKYHVAKDERTPTPRKQIKIEKFVVKTAKLDKDKFDVSVAKFFYANNISFNCVDSVTFKNLLNELKQAITMRYRMFGLLPMCSILSMVDNN